MSQHYTTDFSEYTIIPESHPAIAIYRRTLPQITTLCDTLIDEYVVSLFLSKHTPAVVILAAKVIDISVIRQHTELAVELELGSLHLSSGVIDDKYRLKPQCGASIGVDVVGGGGSLGCYFSAENSGDIYAITCAHLSAAAPELRQDFQQIDRTESSPNRIINLSKLASPGAVVSQPARADVVRAICESYKRLRRKIENYNSTGSKDDKYDVLDALKTFTRLVKLQDIGGCRFGTLTPFAELEPVKRVDEYKDFYQLMDYALVKVDVSRVGENIADSVRLKGVGKLTRADKVSKYGRASGTTFGECNGVESVFRNRRFPNHRFAESVVVCRGFRDLLSPGDSGSVIVDREPGELFEDHVVALGFGQGSAIGGRLNVAFVTPITEIIDRVEKKWGMKLSFIKPSRE